MIDIQSIKKPVLFFNNGIGDHLINMPAIRAIHKLFGNKLSLILEKNFYDLLYSDLELNLLVEINIEYTTVSRYFNSCEVTSKLDECDLFICINPWHSKDVDTLLEYYKPASSIGFFEAYKHKILIDHFKHSAELAFDIVRFLCAQMKIEDFSYSPFLPKYAQLNALKILQEYASCKNILVIHADTAEEKMWSINAFKEFIRLFLSKFKNFTVFVVGIDNYDLHTVSSSNEVISCIGLDLATSMAIVSLSNLFIGVDSCMLHVADAFKIPGIGIFGPTDKNEFGFRNSLCGYVYFK